MKYHQRRRSIPHSTVVAAVVVPRGKPRLSPIPAARRASTSSTESPVQEAICRIDSAGLWLVFSRAVLYSTPDASGRDIPVHGVDRSADTAKRATRWAKAGRNPPASCRAHLVHGGRAIPRSGRRNGQRTFRRVVPAGTVGIFHIPQQVEAHRGQVARGRAIRNNFALLGKRGLPQQMPQAVGARTAGQRGIQQRFVSGGDTAAAAGTETRPQQKEDDASWFE